MADKYTIVEKPGEQAMLFRRGEPCGVANNPMMQFWRQRNEATEIVDGLLHALRSEMAKATKTDHVDSILRVLQVAADYVADRVTTNTLAFDSLRAANESRAAKWNPGGAGIEFAACELAGEVGEACNAVKKLSRLRRGMRGGVDTMDNLAEELADVVICADLLSIELGIDLAAAVAHKFNATSVKHGFPERLVETK